MQNKLDVKTKKTREQLDRELLLVVHNLLPEEEVRIFKDARGNPGRVIVVARTTTFLDYDVGEMAIDPNQKRLI